MTAYHTRPIYNDLFNQGLKTDDYKNRVCNHTLRHTFASHLAINGISLFEIQKLMNHKDINMTMRYMKLAEENKVSAVERIYKIGLIFIFSLFLFLETAFTDFIADFFEKFYFFD